MTETSFQGIAFPPREAKANPCRMCKPCLRTPVNYLSSLYRSASPQDQAFQDVKSPERATEMWTASRTVDVREAWRQKQAGLAWNDLTRLLPRAVLYRSPPS